ncbi:cbb3-type cytochrome c oxidase N-terminal domain-containing protein [Larkinella terrae]|uniref:C-type cytochrome n=1 Tax=Larkinella terrae TaxID=2025311 RepID=A0A7K0ECD3_9BACT|nr:cbb3-type cytochrome c oxidase N-terminal domain-containing protein [Larkinella terrae]MRS59663.1 c-type cytochrome [Larkinella terrae]
MNLLFILLSGNPSTFWTADPGQDSVILMLAILLLIVMIFIGVVALYLVVILRKVVAPAPASISKPVDSRSFWQRMAGLHALNQEKDLMMEHGYDGIQELDNPTPPWFMGLFYGTIAFGIVYLLLFHVLNVGDLQTAEYTQEVAIAEKQREMYIQKVAGSINENTVALVKDAKMLETGKTVFLQNCVACHGPQGQGGVGPNLTDEFWLHGGSVKAVFHTITEGVPEKGMMAWKKQLNPLQIQQVASYILSLQGSKPDGAKEPQGVRETASLSAEEVTKQ